ncbi:uncharacterized protein LOC130010489 [Patella vulgata]|uniref:uncharacterized protein LOC130010489 n=1 Tax=Patella vulgata TaxID=6465 RepID=UPI0024AA0225|nr:uncharacterized protein LOC130010489 [Patella vulgata]
MGCGSSSKGGGKVINQAVAVPLTPPYDGPQVEYQFVNTQVGMTMKMFAFSEGSEMASSDIDSFYPALSSKMAEGYHLVDYRNIPGQTQTAFLSTTAKFPYQGIFMKRQDEPNQSFKLLIEKSSVQATRIRGGLIPSFGAVENQGDCSHLIASIAKHTQNGGRFVCMGTSGQMTSSGLGNMLSGKTPVCGVDLFFEIPDGPSESYVYQTVMVPLQTSTKVGFGGASSTVNCDWIGSFQGPLSQGWKLVSIFFDMSTSMNMQSLTTSNANFNTLWFCEKPAAVVNDPTPRYEGIMIEFQFDMKVGFTGTTSSVSWEPKILEMGRNGWELATILNSPGVQTAGFGKAALKLMMFFQRKILR